MKKLLFSLTALFTLATPAAALPGIPNGAYAGRGKMQTGLGAIPYTSTLTLTDGSLLAEYDYGLSTARYEARVVSRSAIAFDLQNEAGEKIGSGYCFEARCHIDMTSFNAEETLFFKDGRLERLGSMQHDAMTVYYAEDLAAR